MPLPAVSKGAGNDSAVLRCGVQAGVAQLVEQLIRNQQVAGSSPIAGSNKFDKTRALPSWWARVFVWVQARANLQVPFPSYRLGKGVREDQTRVDPASASLQRSVNCSV